MPISMFIDPGKRICGFGIVDTSQRHYDAGGNGQPGQLLNHGVFYSNKPLFGRRLAEIEESVADYVRKYQVTEFVIEEFYFGTLQGKSAVAGLSSIYGMLADMAEAYGIQGPWGVQNSALKKIAGGDGKAEKPAVKKGACFFWNVDPGEIEDFNHSDALGGCMAWAIEGGLIRQKRAEKKSTKQVKLFPEGMHYG